MLQCFLVVCWPQRSSLGSKLRCELEVAEGPKPKEATSKTWRNDEEQRSGIPLQASAVALRPKCDVRKLTEVALLSPVAVAETLQP